MSFGLALVAASDADAFLPLFQFEVSRRFAG